MGIFNIATVVTPDQNLNQVRTAMSHELGFQITKEQAIERMCTIYMKEYGAGLIV